MSTPDDMTFLQDNQEMQSLGRNLRKAREDNGLSQAVVAAHLGIPRASISAIENDKRKVSSIELDRFARLYKRSILSLLGTDIGRRHMQVRRRGMTFATLADGTDLTGWANQRVAQSELPRVIRQLIFATVTRIGRISFPSDEGIQLSGWDGFVEAPEGNAYVPDGISVWELGVNAQIKGKADADYAKRTSDPGDLDLKSATFVFVTPRRWGGKEDWVAEKQKEGVWKDVRAYHADDLATWLELAPGVHLRLSLLMGKSVEGAEDLPRWWEVWSSATRPPFLADLVIAGRDAEADRIRRWLREPPSLISIRGENRDGALAFFAATLGQMDVEIAEPYLARSVVIEQPTAWRSLLTSESPLVLVPTFEDRTIVAAAVSAGHHVLVPLGNGDASSGNTIELPRPNRGAIRESLLEMGISEDKVDLLATLGRRSFAALRRRLAIEPAILTRRWAQGNEAKTLLPALLAGRWDDRNVGDREVLARLAGADYSSVSATLTRWANESDPPVRMVGSTWMLASREEAWQLLSRSLTHDDLQRFADVAVEILAQVDPRYDLPVRERPLAGIHGKVLAQSGHLREGLAETLAVMATYSDSCTLSDVDSGQQWSDRIVHHLLADGVDWRLWASLTLQLPLLAEASPRVFLKAVERALTGDQPVFADLFTDHGEEFGTFDNSPHTGLLWALEALSWSPEHLGDAALYLASLARIDPGGRLGNRPIGSLREIFLSWHPQTAASAIQRLGVVDHIRRRESGTAWQLMIRLLPEIGSTGQFTSKPRWRDWASGAPEEVTWGEFQHASAEIVARLLEDVGTDGHRWRDLIEHITNLPQGDLEIVTERLNEIDPSSFSQADRKVVWESLRKVISRHVAFRDAKWAMTQERLSGLQRAYARFEVGNPIEMSAWLFSSNPEIMVPHNDDWQERLGLIDSERVKAVRAIHADGGISALLDLAAESERPWDVGRAMGLSGIIGEDEDIFLWQNLGASLAPRRSLALGYLAARVADAGSEWLEMQASSKFAAYAAPQQLADFYCHWPFTERTWDRLDKLDEETRRLYWGQVTFWGLGDAITVNHERATEYFVRYGRFDAAIHFISLYAREEGPRVSLATVSEVLQMAIEHGATVNWSDVGFDLAKLLDFLDSWEEKDPANLARIEWVLLPVLRHYGRPPRTLHNALATQPEFFCEVLKSVYRAKGEEPKALTQEEEARAQLAYELLQGWHVLPGLQLNGSVNDAALKAWVAQARELSIESGRGATGDQEIGRILSSAPEGADDVWPHESVRDIIDELNNKDIDLGLVIGVYNSRGTTMRAIGEGGSQERTLVEMYRRYARSVRDRWPRTARVLEQIADGFERDARREDTEAELEEDLWR